MTEAETKARERAERMKAWYKQVNVPEWVSFGKHCSIKNPALYVKTAIDTLDNSTVNSNPFRSAYFRLYRLKKELEQQQHEQRNKI